MQDTLFIILQYCLPHHVLSRLTGKLAGAKTPWLKNILIRIFAKRFAINWQDAARQTPEQYASFNDFFCRELASGARTVATELEAIVSPADGCISQCGPIDHERIFQAKGHHFTLTTLLGSEQDATTFHNGTFATIYLSPKDYHRVHMPLTGKLTKMRYIPGKLFSVNATTANNVPELFARNERAVCFFETEHGPMVVILVGAMIVAAIETVWAGDITPKHRTLFCEDYEDGPTIEKGQEMGRFKLGSTAIVLFPENTATWKTDLTADKTLVMGETIGKVLKT